MEFPESGIDVVFYASLRQLLAYEVRALQSRGDHAFHLFSDEEFHIGKRHGTAFRREIAIQNSPEGIPVTILHFAVPEEIDVSIDFSLSDAKGSVATMALGNTADSKFLVTTAQNYPDTRSILRQLRASISYRFTQQFVPRLEYRFEGYSESYFNQDVMQPYMLPVDPATSGAVFLGWRQPGYSAHILYLVLSYSF